MQLRTLVPLLMLSFSLFGQRPGTSNELGLFLGGSNFIGDVGNYGVHMPQGYAAGVSFRHHFDYHYGIRAQFSYGMIANDDKLSTWDSRQFRNLHFRSPVYEGMVVAEVNFFPYRTGHRSMNHTPYLFGGIGVVNYNPQARYEGEWHRLQPLGTEGQRTSANSANFYSRSAWIMPFGMGYRWSLGQSWNISLEVGFRRTSSDYLDDVSGNYVDPNVLREERSELAAELSNRTDRPEELAGYARGNNQTNDWYVFTGVHLHFQLTPFIERCANFISR